jgi:hypothetical protein
MLCGACAVRGVGGRVYGLGAAAAGGLLRVTRGAGESTAGVCSVSFCCGNDCSTWRT